MGQMEGMVSRGDTHPAVVLSRNAEVDVLLKTGYTGVAQSPADQMPASHAGVPSSASISGSCLQLPAGADRGRQLSCDGARNWVPAVLVGYLAFEFLALSPALDISSI